VLTDNPLLRAGGSFGRLRFCPMADAMIGNADFKNRESRSRVQNTTCPVAPRDHGARGKTKGEERRGGRLATTLMRLP
jgi:hypothetical protein